MDLVEIKKRLNKEFRDFTFGKEIFPMLFQTGIANAAVHSTGVSYLLALGINFGLSAIAEYPTIVHSDEQWKKTSKVMPDSIWFHPLSNQPWIAFEFERFEKGDEQKIEGKVRNLALSYYQSCKTIELCVLIYWLRSGIAPREVDPLKRIFEQGFSANGIAVAAPNCALSLYKFVFCQASTSFNDENIMIKDEQSNYLISNNNPIRLSVSSTTKVQ